MADPDPRSLGAALDASVRLGSEREALVAGDLRLSYRALADAADEVADRLRAAGVAPGERIGIALPNAPAFVVAFFGIVRAGAVAMPIHARSTEGERARRLADARLVFDSPELRPIARDAPASRAPEGSALTQFSTGQSSLAKRITRTHDQLLREVSAVAERLRIGPDDRILGVAPLFHSYGLVNAMLSSLLGGGTLVLLDGSDLLPRELLDALAAERITGFPGVPVLFDALVSLRPGRDPDLSALRYCTSAGAPLSPATSGAFVARYGARVHQLYGTTETGVVSVDLDGPPEAVGTPIRGVSIALVDEEGAPVPDGGTGDVEIRSDAMARGYDARDPGDAFVGAAFRPGDLGRLDAGGRLVLTGRRQRFVNVGGDKVDPAEVEEVLRSLDGVSDAIVVGVPDPIGGERVHAVVVGTLERARVLEHCRAHLAPHKVPRSIAFRDAIPRSPLGKVLREALIEEVS